MELMKIDFVPGIRWDDKYQRNNKSKWQKNLRCFPSCCPGSHKTGFCGRSIGVNLFYERSRFDKKRLIVLGEFNLSGTTPYKIGAILTLKMTNDENKTRHRITGEIQGKHHDFLQAVDVTLPKDMAKEGSCRMTFEFNHRLKGWHYGFVGSKKTRHYSHVFRAYALELVNSKEKTYRVLDMVSSPKWKMTCRPRKPLSGSPLKTLEHQPDISTASIFTKHTVNGNGNARKRAHPQVTETPKAPKISTNKGLHSRPIPGLPLSPKDYDDFALNIFDESPVSPISKKQRLLNRKDSFPLILPRKDSFTITFPRLDSFPQLPVKDSVCRILPRKDSLSRLLSRKDSLSRLFSRQDSFRDLCKSMFGLSNTTQDPQLITTKPTPLIDDPDWTQIPF